MPDVSGVNPLFFMKGARPFGLAPFIMFAIIIRLFGVVYYLGNYSTCMTKNLRYWVSSAQSRDGWSGD